MPRSSPVHIREVATTGLNEAYPARVFSQSGPRQLTYFRALRGISALYSGAILTSKTPKKKKKKAQTCENMALNRPQKRLTSGIRAETRRQRGALLDLSWERTHRVTQICSLFGCP